MIKPKKRYGQHFLTAPAYCRRIADSLDDEDGGNLLEIGPGKGALTAFLHKRFGRLHAVEIDDECIAQLKERFADGSVRIHACDALTFDYAEAGFPLAVVGNLPYNRAAPIIRRTLAWGASIRSCCFMVQREVAERIAAGPGSKKNGFLSILCQFFGTPKILFHVPPGAFFPRPNVMSSVISMRIDPHCDRRLPPREREPFFAFVDKGFSQRRKMVAKVLGEGNRTETFRELLAGIGCRPEARAEDLGIESWLSLYRLYRGLRP